MARLRSLQPRLTGLGHRLAAQASIGQPLRQGRDNAAPWRRWYKTARWQRLRMATLIRDLFTCRMCSKVEANTANLVCDHIKPHRGNEAMFWDETNTQCLCRSCHDGRKQQEEQANVHHRGIWD